MYTPAQYGVFSELATDVNYALETNGIAIVGKETADGKIAWLGDELYREIAPMANIILIEADGSKRLPVKFPNEHEPVIPPDVDVILAVSGLSAIGRYGNDACHRWPLARKALNILNEEEVLNQEHLSILMQEGYLTPLQKKYPSLRVIPIFNQADDEALVEIGKKIIDELKTEKGIVSSMLPLEEN